MKIKISFKLIIFRPKSKYLDTFLQGIKKRYIGIEASLKTNIKRNQDILLSLAHEVKQLSFETLFVTSRTSILLACTFKTDIRICIVRSESEGFLFFQASPTHKFLLLYCIKTSEIKGNMET